MARQPAPPAPPAPPVTLPPCQSGYRCGDNDRRPATDDLHIGACMLSTASRSRRRARIDALTRAQLRDMADFLSGWSATGTDFALARVADAGTVTVLRPEHMPDGAL